MNRRNFFGTIAGTLWVAIAGVVLGGNVEAAEAADTWGFAAGDDLLLKPADIVWDSANGLRLMSSDDLYTRVFIREPSGREVHVGGGAVTWGNLNGIVIEQDSAGDAVIADSDWYGAWL